MTDLARLRDLVLEAACDLDATRMRDLTLTAFAEHGTDIVVVDVLVPVLHEIGDRWEAGKLGVIHEHHASHVVRSLVAEFHVPGSGDEATRRVVLACPPGELHDLPVHLFAAMLRERGWSPLLLGANTPWRVTTAAARLFRAHAYVLSGMRPWSLASRRSGLEMMAESTPVFVAGPAAAGLDVPGLVVLPDDWRAAAATVDRIPLPPVAPEPLAAG